MAKKKATKKTTDSAEAITQMLYNQARLLKGMDSYLESIEQLMENILKSSKLVRQRYTQYVDELRKMQEEKPE